MTYEVRGPDPDGDWFIVLIDGEDETAIDEVFSSAGNAQAMVERLSIPAPIERAARALFTYEPGPYGDCVEWAIEQPFGWIDCVDQVRLVLEAIREPGHEIIEAVQSATDKKDFRMAVSTTGLSDAEAGDLWRTIIDALNAKSASQAET